MVPGIAAIDTFTAPGSTGSTSAVVPGTSSTGAFIIPK